MKLFISFILTISFVGGLYAQDETADLKTALIVVSEVMAQERAKADVALQGKNSINESLIKEIQDLKKERDEANSRTILLSSLPLPVGLFIGGSIRGDFKQGSVLACSSIAIEAVIFGISELYKMTSVSKAHVTDTQ